MVNYVHFLLEGECELIEHIIVREERSIRGTHYELYDSKTSTTGDEMRRSLKNLEAGEQKIDELVYEYKFIRVEFFSITNRKIFACLY